MRLEGCLTVEKAMKALRTLDDEIQQRNQQDDNKVKLKTKYQQFR
jgi:hypothetical protein